MLLVFSNHSLLGRAMECDENYLENSTPIFNYPFQVLKSQDERVKSET